MSNTNEPSAAALIRAQGQQIRRETADPAGDSVGIFTETMWIKG